MSLICPKWDHTTGRLLMPLLLKSQARMKEKVKAMLLTIRFVSLTVDLWTDRRLRSFIGITAHFIGEKFSFQSLTLSCKPIKQTSHTGELIKNSLDETIIEYGIGYILFINKLS